MITAFILVLLNALNPVGNTPPPWHDCPYGQQLVAQTCQGDALLMDMRSANTN